MFSKYVTVKVTLIILKSNLQEVLSKKVTFKLLFKYLESTCQVNSFNNIFYVLLEPQVAFITLKNGLLSRVTLILISFSFVKINLHAKTFLSDSLRKKNIFFTDSQNTVTKNFFWSYSMAIKATAWPSCLSFRCLV